MGGFEGLEEEEWWWADCRAQGLVVVVVREYSLPVSSLCCLLATCLLLLLLLLLLQVFTTPDVVSDRLTGCCWAVGCSRVGGSADVLLAQVRNCVQVLGDDSAPSLPVPVVYVNVDVNNVGDRSLDL